MRAPRLAASLVALAVVAGWNAFVARVGRENVPEPPDDPVSEPDLVEHERNWYDYLRGFHAHHGGAFGDHPEHGSFWPGLELWLETHCLRGYTLGNHTYLCPNAPRVLRVHQAGHAPSFGRQFETLWTERRPDGGLDDEPLWAFDVMLPGDFPHALLRFRDLRGLGETYGEWVRDGRVRRV
jgi:hypothetical protein